MVGIVSVQVETYSWCSIGGRLSHFMACGHGRLIAGESRWIVIGIKREDNRHAISWAEEFSGLLFPWLARSQHDPGVMTLATSVLAQPRPIIVAGNI